MSSKKLESAFLTKAVKWNEGVRRGFIVYPHNEDGTSWGEPFIDEEGNLIVPGTPDGINPDAVMGVKDGKWRSFRDEKMQAAGNIDWKGPWINEAATKRRIVTVNGPSQRYWNTGSFVYDAAPASVPGETVINKNHYIYYNGRVCGITPRPVLGACWIEKEVNATDEFGNTLIDVETNQPLKVEQKWVIAICKDGTSDVCYAREKLEALSEDFIDAETFEFVKRQDKNISEEEEEENPDVRGWIELGRWEGFTDSIPGVAPEAPWFFDVEGGMARTMRRCEYTHTLQYTGDPMDDMLYREIYVTIDLDTLIANFGVQDTEEWVTSPVFSTHLWGNKTKTEKFGPREYIQPANESADGEPHRFDEWGVYITVQMDGASKLAVDFKPDTNEWVYGWFDGNFGRVFAQYHMVGTDDGVTYGITNPNTGNESLGALPKPEPATLDDHWPRTWIGLNDIITLNINNNPTNSDPFYSEIAVLWGRQGDSSVMNGGPPDPNDTTLAFMDSYDTWLKYVDIRHNMVIGEVLYNFLDATQGFGAVNVVEETMLWSLAGDEGFNPDDYRYSVEDTPIQDAADTHLFYRYASKAPRFEAFSTYPSVSDPALGFSLTEVQAFEEPTGDIETVIYEQVGYQFSFSLTNENENEEDYEPYWKTPFPDWFLNDTRPNWEKLNFIEMLRDPKCESKGIYGMTEMGEHFSYIEYFDPVEKDNVAKEWSRNVDGDAVESVKGGTRLYPGGLF